MVQNKADTVLSENKTKKHMVNFLDFPYCVSYTKSNTGICTGGHCYYLAA